MRWAIVIGLSLLSFPAQAQFMNGIARSDTRAAINEPAIGDLSIGDTGYVASLHFCAVGHGIFLIDTIPLLSGQPPSGPTIAVVRTPTGVEIKVDGDASGQPSARYIILSSITRSILHCDAYAQDVGKLTIDTINGMGGVGDVIAGQ